LDTLRLKNADFIVRGRTRDISNHVFDISSTRVDEFMRIPADERRPDLYRSQETIPDVHPDQYRGPGLNLRDSHLREGYDPTRLTPESRFAPTESRDLAPREGSVIPPPNRGGLLLPGETLPLLPHSSANPRSGTRRLGTETLSAAPLLPDGAGVTP